MLDWFSSHGRKDLPWQLEPTPYRVWISEIMLQQTQVAVVIPYFERFMARFPTLSQLAAADQDDVLRHWAGLGYYARARNLHRAAGILVRDYQGKLPADPQQLMQLPGIGRSTAGAILSLALGQPQAILDGNVKRVLARCFAIPGWPGQHAVQKRLWAVSEQLMAATAEFADNASKPSLIAAYNQAMMDLGATLCSRHSAACDSCPLASRCIAHLSDSVQQYPEPKPARIKPKRGTRWLLIQDPDGKILLEQRVTSGLWGGLWTLPEIAPDQTGAHWCQQQLGRAPQRVEKLADRQHSFSHFELEIFPELLVLEQHPTQIADDEHRLWITLDEALKMAIPAPLKRLLQVVVAHHHPG
ncbi:A/G-specific adenine glycosylase [Rhabdochromatium marinum]|uniref:A/G-specific adenine glycosylase n=1 Tax=Rhabdochromatium marinum TaxID=48729 RepID=UPI003084526C